jgi:L-fuconolactonase
MRIDSHQHFWKYNPVRDQWITDEMAVIRRDFLPEDILPELRANHIDGCIAVQADQSEEETQFLLDLAKENDFIRAVIGWVDLRAGNVAECLASLSQKKKLRGFRHIVQAEPDDRFMLQRAFLRGIGGLRQFGFTYDILVYPRQLSAAIELVTRFPNQPFVIDHMGKPEIRAQRSLPWAQQMREIAANRNVYCKISGMLTEADWKNWKIDDCKPYLDTVFEAFGCDRIIFGSDWPVCLLAASYSQVIGLIADYTRNFSPADKAKIFGLNAARFYGIADC